MPDDAEMDPSAEALAEQRRRSEALQAGYRYLFGLEEPDESDEDTLDTPAPGD